MLFRSAFARERSMNIPKDLSIIGFDDNPRCVYDKFALTTVRQPFSEMAHTAVKILKDLVNEKTESIQRIVLTPELIIRDTVGSI